MRTIRQRLHDDEGISLVELLVAMVLLGVVLSATASTLISSFVAIGGNENRTRATALANEELENLRALEWDDVGFYGNDVFPAGMVTVKPTVILGPTRPGASRAPRPAQVIINRGPEYRVTRTIEWVENTQTSSSTRPDDEDYKRLRVSVEWTDTGGQERRVDQETLRAPTPLDERASDFVLSLYDVTPQVVRINDDGSVRTGQSPSPLQFSALTSSSADFLRVSFLERGRTTATESSLTAPDRVTWSGSHTTGTYPNGEVVFTFVATRALPVKQEVIGRRTVRFLQDMRFATFTLTPSTMCLAVNETTPAVQVDLLVHGVVAEDIVTVSVGGGVPITAASVPNGATESGTAFRAMIPAGTYTETQVVTATALRQQTESLSDSRTLTVQRQGTDGSCG